MKHSVLSSVVVLFILSVLTPLGLAQNAGAAKPFSAHDILFSGPELDFFCKYMLDREFVLAPESKVTRWIDNGKIEVDFDRTVRFTNLSVSPGGFSFNVLLSVKQTNYDLDAEGKRILPGQMKNRTLIEKHTFSRSKSTGKIVGRTESICHDIPNTVLSMTRNQILFMEDEDKMVIIEIPDGFIGDYFTTGGKYKPGTAKNRTEIVVKDGKVIRTLTSETFDIDPETMKITPTGGDTTPYIDFTVLETP